jgi:hypothetical protein
VALRETLLDLRTSRVRRQSAWPGNFKSTAWLPGESFKVAGALPMNLSSMKIRRRRDPRKQTVPTPSGADDECESSVCGFASGLLFVTVAGENGEAGILGEAGIAEGEIAQDEDGSVGRFDPARMKTIGTEASIQGVMRLLPCIRHESKDSAECGRGNCQNEIQFGLVLEGFADALQTTPQNQQKKSKHE